MCRWKFTLHLSRCCKVLLQSFGSVAIRAMLAAADVCSVQSAYDHDHIFIELTTGPDCMTLPDIVVNLLQSLLSIPCRHKPLPAGRIWLPTSMQSVLPCQTVYAASCKAAWGGPLQPGAAACMRKLPASTKLCSAWRG